METLKNHSKREIADIMGVVYQGLIQYASTRLGCPVLITYVEKDVTGKVRGYYQRWKEGEQHPLITIPNAAHNANMDNPEVFNRIPDDFLVEFG